MRELMDETHVEGRPVADDGAPIFGDRPEGSGLASVDQLLADLWA
ncbi:MAG: hypothetical protein ACR2LJ_10875 [Acidimicrobiales bacterium]